MTRFEHTMTSMTKGGMTVSESGFVCSERQFNKGSDRISQNQKASVEGLNG